MTDFSIYVASLTDYNHSVLYGVNIDLEGKTAEDIQAEVNHMLASSPAAKKYGEVAEEWAIHAYDFGGMHIGENDSFEFLIQLMEAIEEHGEAFSSYHQQISGNCDLETAIEEFEDAYCGQYDSEDEYAQELFDECYDVPNHLANYIDYEKFSRDLFISDYYSQDAKSSGVHVFRHV
jgi:antirestriction protein